MNNVEIARLFEELGELLELRGENAFRTRAYRNGAKAIAELPEPVGKILADGGDLTQFDGIGATLAEKCQTIVDTGRLPQLDKLREEIPPVLIQMTRIPGLGVKKAILLHKELGLTSLEDLKAACEAEKVRVLKGFAAKTEKLILDGLEIAAAASERLPLDKAEKLVHRLKLQLDEIDCIDNLEFAGSFRRGKETVGDIDILVVSEQVDVVMDCLEAFPGRVSTIMRGDTKMSIRVDEQFQVDLRVVPAESFGAALQYFTGSKEHNVAVRSRARKMGLTVNEYGVSKIDSQHDYFAGATEEELYQSLGLEWVPPELREGRRELAWASGDDPKPEIVQLTDIVCDLHMHTTATDGSATIEEMRDAARARGLKHIAITDHSQRVSMAMGLKADQLLAQWEQIDRLNEACEDDFVLLKGIECDILENGDMDLPDEVLAQGDWVIASVHYGQKQPRQQITDRIVGALENPHIDIVAHPTGRLLGARPAYDVDLDAVFTAAETHGKALELNASPRRLDLSEENLMQAIARGIPIAINTDAHSPEGMDAMRYGITQARRAGILKSQVINTWPIDKLREWLQR